MRLFFLLLVYGIYITPTVAEEIVAFVNEEPITDTAIVRYARQSPLLVTYLSVPGGPMVLLDNMIKERLFLLEGKRLGIARPEKEDHDFAYALKVREELLKPCPEPTEAEAKAFYAAHPEVFSTPLLLRVSRIGLRFSEDTIVEVEEKLRAILQRIESGQLSFAEAASRYSEDTLSKARGGDIGFEPIADLQNPVFALMSQASDKDIIGPVQEKDMLYLYQVTDRREPILEPYETARARAGTEQRKNCQQRVSEQLIAELKQRWPVKILVDEISIQPEQP